MLVLHNRHFIRTSTNFVLEHFLVNRMMRIAIKVIIFGGSFMSVLGYLMLLAFVFAVLAAVQRLDLVLVHDSRAVFRSTMVPSILGGGWYILIFAAKRLDLVLNHGNFLGGSRRCLVVVVPRLLLLDILVVGGGDNNVFRASLLHRP